MLSIPERYGRRTQARLLALKLMVQHGLSEWTFAFNRRKRALGLCKFGARIIELSIYLVDRNEQEEVRETILHEIAHALVGPEHGHDAVWQAKAIEIGAKPQRCGQADMPEGQWRADCKGCGKVYSRHRRPKRLKGWFCRLCGPQRGSLSWGVMNQARRVD